MENIRKKLPEINVDILSVKPIKVKEQVFLSDDIEINLILKENDELKQLNQDCKAEILYSITNNNITTSVEQKDNVLIDTLLSKIIIHPNKNALRLGANKISIKIYDIDEQLYLCPLLLNVQATTDSNLIVDNSNEIQVLKDLENKLVEIDDEIVKVNTDIDNIETRIENAENTVANTVAEMESLVNLEINETRDKLTFEEARIDQAIEEMDNKLNNKNQEIDKIFLKSIEMTSYVDGNFVSFKSKIINISARDLCKYSFNYHVNGCVYAESINTVTVGLLTFSNEGDVARINNVSLYTRNVQGNTVLVASKFLPTNTTSINSNEFGYYIKLETNIKSQYINSARCCLSVIGSGLF